MSSTLVTAADEPSTCFGTTSKGRLENGWKLPTSGKNYAAYALLGASIGRAYVHSEVHRVLIAAYAALETSAPGVVFVYGETGKKRGGQFKPHKIHRNGLSMDLRVPCTP